MMDKKFQEALQAAKKDGRWLAGLETKQFTCNDYGDDTMPASAR